MAYSVAETAEMLGLSTKTVYRLIRTGTLRHRRIGRKILIPCKAVVQFCNG